MLPDHDKPALGQDLYMKGNCLPTHVKLLCHRIEIERLLCNPIQYFSSGRVGYCLEHISSGLHHMQVFACATLFEEYSFMEISHHRRPRGQPRGSSSSTSPKPSVSGVGLSGQTGYLQQR